MKQDKLLVGINGVNSLKQPFKIFLAITAFIIFGCGFSFPQSSKNELIKTTDIKRFEHIAALEKRIAEAGNDFVYLSAEEYELLLSQQIGTVEGFDSLASTGGGIIVGYGFPEESRIFKTDIQIVLPNIPNIGEGDIFVILDYVKGDNGLDYLDKLSNTEIEEDKFTQLELYRRTIGSKKYLFGSRNVHLRDSDDYIRALGALGNGVELSEVSGKVVMQLPTNIKGITLSMSDIGLKKSFAGGVITLKEIKENYISFDFTGNDENIFAWEVYDSTNSIIELNDYQLNDGIYKLYSDHPKSIKLYQSETVRKEYPFVFGNSGTSSQRTYANQISESKSLNENKITIPEFHLQELNATYLEENDPVFILIKDRVVRDMKITADPTSLENKSIAEKLKTFSEEKNKKLENLFRESLTNYTTKIHFDVGTLMTVFKVLAEKPIDVIEKEYEIRVQDLNDGNYAAEFWEDGLAVNSEEHAIAWANELALKYPDDNEILKTVKETYTNARKSIEDGEVDRYSKVMALLYTKEKGGILTYHNPFQIMIDFE